MTQRSNFLPMVVALVALGGMGKFVHQLYKKQITLENELFALRDSKHNLNTHMDIQGTQVVEKIVSNSQAWRPIQERVKDTVVQVFAQIAEVDLLQPFKSPNQYAASGSGFFINENGDLITNAHVVDQAKSVWVQIPSFGKRIIDVDVVSVSPERDIALLRVKPEALALIKETLGAVPFLPLGDSDIVRRSDEVLALGYPLGQQALKSTTGVISGREQHLIQMSAALNPGNSGGPLLNINGEVVGINSAIIQGANNVGYIIPINDLRNALADLNKMKLLRKPYLGVLINNATDCLAEYLGNPQPGGCYVVEVVPGSTLDKAGIQRGDMLYEINGHRLDIFGEMNVPWAEDKISLVDYVTRLSIGEDVHLVAYRSGDRLEATVKFSQASLPAVRRIFPGYEAVDYEVFAGMVVMPMSLNHIQMLAGSASGLAKYAELKNQAQQKLIITHIFPSSQLYRSRSLAVGATINEVNGIEVHTLDDFRNAIKKSDKFLTIRASDNVSRASDNVLVSLMYDKVLQEEPKMAMDFKYPLSKTAQDLIKAHAANRSVIMAQNPTNAETSAQVAA
jgi:serine protease Do